MCGYDRCAGIINAEKENCTRVVVCVGLTDVLEQMRKLCEMNKIASW